MQFLILLASECNLIKMVLYRDKILFVLLLFVVTLTTANEIPVYERCGFCYQGKCNPTTLVQGQCTKVQSVCNSQNSSQYYFVSNIGSKNNYTINFYQNQFCNGTSESSELTCNRCQTRPRCSTYYINCGWNIWQILFMMVVALLVVGFAGIVIFVVVRKPKPRMTAFTVDSMDVITSAPVQDTHSSFFYGSPSNVNSSYQSVNESYLR